MTHILLLPLSSWLVRLRGLLTCLRLTHVSLSQSPGSFIVNSLPATTACAGSTLSQSSLLLRYAQRLPILAALVALALLTTPTALAQTVQSFSYTGGVQTFVVPTGVTTLTVVANGAQGGRGGGNTAGGRGRGGRVTATLTVTPGQSLSLYVGGLPFNGGGAGGVGSTSDRNGGAGGGATDIRIGGTALANRVLVAGGGGGGGSCQGPGPVGGRGGDGGGTGGNGSDGTGLGGAGGTGAGGAVGIGSAGAPDPFAAGGGGGGGFLGGGGGVNGADIDGGGGGGGGGNSYPATASGIVNSIVHQQGVNTGNGSLSINYCLPRLYVKANATGANTGLSWNDAFTDLQSALNYTCSQNLTEIWVAAGTYKPTSTTARDASFAMKNGVAIYGGFVGNEQNLTDRPAINPVTGNPSSSTLSGDIGTVGVNTDNSYHVITNLSGLTTSAILDGFVITGGYAHGIGNNDYGGAIFNNSSSPVLTNCSLQNNQAQYGGAIYNQSSSNPALTNCSLQSNTANTGGAIYNNSSSPAMTNCRLQSNLATFGGAIYNFQSSPTLTECNLQSNTATTGGSGGAIYNDSQSNPALTNCSLQSNLADYGGAINNQSSSSPVLTNCSLQSNTATNSGGAIYNITQCSPVLINCSLQSNQAPVGGAIYNRNNSNPVLTNSVVWNNDGGSTFSNVSSSITATYSLFDASVTSYSSGPTNLTATTSPFVSTTSVALLAGSAAINAGNPASMTVNSGPYSATALPQTDLAGNPRIVGCRVDMGAVEFQSLISFAISQQPASGTSVCVGGNASASVSTTGTVTAYQWYKNGNPVNGQTAATLSLTNVQTADVGSYSVVVTGACNSLTSNAFSLTLNSPPTNASLTSGTLACANSSLTLTASGGTSYTLNNNNQTNTTGLFVVSQPGTYTVTVSNASGCTATATSTVTGGISTTAGTAIWTGCTSTDWNTATNWSGGFVPTPTDNAIIPSAPANQPILSTTATAKSVEVQTGASFTITSAGSLTINNSRSITRGGLTYATSFYNEGTVVNAGQLILGNTAPVGVFAIWNKGTFTNNGGAISIDRTTNQGIDNNAGTFTNTGTITIGALASVGSQGIWNQTIFTNTGGRITIDRTTGEGLLNTNSFVNSATLTIGASASIGGVGISNGNSASFTNVAGSYLQIDRTGSHAIATSGLFINASVISIGSETAVGAQGISNSGTFNNNVGGNITINRTGTGVGGDGLYNGGTFVNSSSLTIGDVAFVGQDDIYNVGIFRNTARGQIRADRATSNGLWNLGSGTVQNDGKIFIGSVANTGVGILNTGTSFSNNTGASIQLDRVSRGLTNVTTFINAGQIRMGNNVPLRERGLLHGNGSGTVPAVFNNLAGALLQIDQTAAGQDGITNEVLTTFTNSGTVSIGTSGSIGANGIANAGTVSNSACATMTVFAPINNGNSFTNAGLFTVNTTKPHSNTTTLTNNGVISYPQGNPIPNVTNNDVIVAPFSLCGTTSTTALQIGGANSFSVGTTWYTDAGLTTPGGTYNQATNTFTPTSLSAGNGYTLYFTATDNVNNCTQTVPVSVTVNAVPARLYVAASQTATSGGDGLTWSTAFKDLQSALNYACSQSLTEIWVAAGTYKPTSTTARTISFAMKNGVAIYGGFMGNETALSQRPAINPVSENPSRSTLSGDIGTAGNTSDNSYHVISNPTGLTTTAILDGFVITGGAGSDKGGGMYNDGSSPTLQNCLFQANSVSGGSQSYGGAMFNSNYSSPILTNCAFQSNSAIGGYNNGGAISNQGNCSPTLVNCSFINNLCSGGTYDYGGAMDNSEDSDPQLINCSFLNNQCFGGSSANAGALFNNSYGSEPHLTNCVVFGHGPNQIYASAAGLVVATYSLFDNTNGVDITGPGNLTTTTSPFVSTTSVALLAGSPATNAGNPASITVASPPYSATALPQTDLAANPRIIGGRVDMGALELQAAPVAITRQPATGSAVCTGATVTASVSVTGTGPFSYQWYKDGPSGVPASLGPPQSTSALSLTNVQPAQAGSYSVVVVGTANSVTSTAFSLTLNSPPTNASLTSGTLICANSSFTLTASGGTSYTLGNQTNTTGLFVVSQPGTYTVTVTNASGCTATATTSVTIAPATIFTTQPPAQSLVCVGSTVSVSALATGTGLVSYRWFRTNATTPLAGQSSPVLSLTGIQPTDAGSYVCVATAGCGSTTSTAFTLTLNAVFVSQAGAGTQNGSTWANAYPATQLQTAIDQAASTTANCPTRMVWIAAGTYKPTVTTTYSTPTQRAVSFSMQNNVWIYGGFNGTETFLSQRPAINAAQPSSTTLSGQIGDATVDDNSYHVVYNRDVDSTALLDGVVVSGGNTSPSNVDQSYGGGVFNDGSGAGHFANPRFQFCWFTNNQAGLGGGMGNHGSAGQASPRLTGCVFRTNTASRFGGGFYTDAVQGGVASVVLRSCVFFANQALGGPAIASVAGDGICQVQLLNTTIVNNTLLPTTQGSQAAPAPDRARTQLLNCIVRGNSSQAFTIPGSSVPPIITYSDLDYADAGPGNLQTDPQFVSASAGDLRLLAGSALIDGGDPASTTALVGSLDAWGQPRITGGRIDIGAFEGGVIVDIYTLKDGLWSDPTVWSVGRVPQAGERLRVLHSVTIPGAYVAQGGQIVYGTNGRLLFSLGGQIRLMP